MTLINNPLDNPLLVPVSLRLAGVLGIPAERMSVKATTNEGMGFLGRGEGIAAHAVALLAKEGFNL